MKSSHDRKARQLYYSQIPIVTSYIEALTSYKLDKVLFYITRVKNYFFISTKITAIYLYQYKTKWHTRI